MREYLGDYIKGIDDKIKEKNVTEKDIENHLIKIEFFLWNIFVFISNYFHSNMDICNSYIYCLNFLTFLCQTLFLLRKQCSIFI